MKRIKTFKTDRPKLYLVGTPIGNLQDISERASKTLEMVDIIYCEDTKNTIRLLTHFNIKKPLRSLHEHNEKEKTDDIISVLSSGQSVAYVSDAGNPIISDPGSLLVKSVNNHNFEVVTILGPSAFLHALINSTFDSSSFTFYGFLDRQESKRNHKLSLINERTEVAILYEAPHRIEKLLQSIEKVMPTRKLCLARELTKIHEEFIYGTATEILSLDMESIRGEIVLVIDRKQDEIVNYDDDIIRLFLEYKKDKALSTTAIIKKICDELSVRKNHVYEIVEEYRKKN